MNKTEKNDLLIVAGVVVVFSALAFICGVSVGGKKKKQMIVTPKGELKEVEAE